MITRSEEQMKEILIKEIEVLKAEASVIEAELKKKTKQIESDRKWLMMINQRLSKSKEEEKPKDTDGA